MNQNRIFQLSESGQHERIRMLADAVSVEADRRSSWVTVTRAGNFTDPRYGSFSITRQMLSEMISNFTANVYGQDIAIDVDHKPGNGAAGYVRQLQLDGSKLRALVEWTEYGIEAITKKGFKYLSAEFCENFIDNELQKQHGPTLLAAGLTVRPVIKGLDVVQCSESDSGQYPTLISEQLIKQLHEEDTMKWQQLIAAMMAFLKPLKLSEGVLASFKKLAEDSLAGIEEEAKAKLIIENIQNGAKTLAEAHPNATNVTMQLASPSGLTHEDVVRILTEQKTAEDNQRKQLSEKLESKQKVLSETINAAQGIDDEAKASMITALSELVTVDMSDDQLKKLGERELEHANKEAAHRQLSEMGITLNSPSGRVHLQDVPTNEAARLQNIQHQQLRTTSAFYNGQIRLSEDKALPGFVRDVLNLFDAQHSQQIGMAVRTLSEGVTNVSDSNLPIGFQREVIREALSDLNVLALVSTYTDASATATTQIPYEQRHTGGIANDGIVYERSPIPKVKVSQKMDLAYINAMKLAIDVSNEVLHFTRTAGINWDAWGRNVASAARLVKELLCRRIANELQRCADAFMAMFVTNEGITKEGNVYKTDHFPIVRQRQVFDLQGNAVGQPENPIVVKDGSTELKPWDGSGKQPSGLYYHVVNYNLGYVSLVDQDGVLEDPAGAVKISYSYATNIVKVDADIPVNVAKEKHLNGLIQAISAQKAMMASGRYVTPDFALMSPTLNDTATNAEQFTMSAKRDGVNTTAQGDLEKIKGIEAWGTNAPGIDLGDERILLGQRSIASYTVAKPWSMSEPVEARDENGNLTGARESYGEEYNAIHVPKPLYDRFTSVLYFSFTNR